MIYISVSGSGVSPPVFWRRFSPAFLCYYHHVSVVYFFSFGPAPSNDYIFYSWPMVGSSLPIIPIKLLLLSRYFVCFFLMSCTYYWMC
uniref:Uncharacterized protein n=1 Tax=Picea glauca TaxID=3330 RepID=A0A117NH04_PICGL|nr:hypothetical protein ABT39_MTgene5787 [Picea glauca]QHR90437.1 hypothetical protein Q903MT_gene4461 [Picea sitchensis]